MLRLTKSAVQRTQQREQQRRSSPTAAHCTELMRFGQGIYKAPPNGVILPHFPCALVGKELSA